MILHSHATQLTASLVQVIELSKRKVGQCHVSTDPTEFWTVQTVDIWLNKKFRTLNFDILFVFVITNNNQICLKKT